MTTKYGRRVLPPGYNPTNFTYMGRSAKDQGDFDDDVGIADMACVNQFGEANNSKHYHGGVVQYTDGSWWIYLEWGRVKPGRSWDNDQWTGTSQDYQFIKCDDETAARKTFAKQMNSKNTSRLEKRKIAGVEVWAAKTDKKGEAKSGYLVLSLATREKGLPDALKIKEGEVPKPEKKVKKAAIAPAKHFQRQVVELAQALVGGTQSYTRALSEASGVVPTLEAIIQVRDALIPAALKRIKSVGDSVEKQIKDKGLRDISKMVFALVPQQIPKGGLTDAEAILSSDNILRVQQDLDTFESALDNEDFEIEAPNNTVNPDQLLNAKLRWLDLAAEEGRYVQDTLLKQTNNRHGYLRSRMKIKNVFAVVRTDRDAEFLRCAEDVAKKREGNFDTKANLQPHSRYDLTEKESILYQKANVIFVQHGTRSVNIHPIVATHFRLPKSLPGAMITGNNFGSGLYGSVDYRKAAGYTSLRNAHWSRGSGAIRDRGAFMFLLDMIMGKAYIAPSTGSWNKPPARCDSVFGVGGVSSSLKNDEMVVFNPHYNRIRYLVEFTF